MIRMRFLRVLSLVTVAFLAASGAGSLLGQTSAEAPSGLEEVLSVGGPDGDKLLMWVGLAVDDDGSLFVTDAMDYAIKVFDGQGRLLRKTGHPGTGPGEFQNLRELAVSSSLVFVTDQNKPEISVFNKDLRYRYSIPVSRPISSLRARPDGTIVAALGAVQKNDPGTIWLADSSGRTLAEIPHGTDPKNPTGVRVSLALAGPDFILAYNFRDLVIRLDRTGRTVWARTLFNFPEAKTQNILGFKLPTEFIYKDVAVDRAGRIYVLGGGMAKNPSRDVYVLTPEGKLLATLTLPDSTHSLVLDSRDYLYSRANSGLTIKKYKVKLPLEKGVSVPARHRP
jgi:hypothetical protein